MTQPSSTFQKEFFIPFHYVDAAGVVFFGHVFTLAHQVFEAFLVESLHCPWKNWFQNPEWIVPIKSSDALYHAPLLAGSSCRIQLNVAEIRPSSFCIHYRFFQQEQLCCTVKTVHVFCNRQTGRKQAIPSDLIAPLQNHLSNNLEMKVLS